MQLNELKMKFAFEDKLNSNFSKKVFIYLFKGL